MDPITFERDAPAGEALSRLLAWFKAWLVESAPTNIRLPWKGIHDEGTYLTSWREYFLHTKDPEVISYATSMLASADAWMHKHLTNGYWRMQEVHHGVEHFIIFLAWMHELVPDEPIHQRQLRDASAHVARKGSRWTRWYNPTRNRFTSLFLGSRFVGIKKSLNIAEHLRMIRLAWLGLACGGDPALASIVTSYSLEWASQIVNGPEIPLHLDEFTETDLTKRAESATSFKKDASSFLGAQPKDITPATRSEIHVANGTPGLFLALHAATREQVYLDAAERIVGAVINHLDTPYAHPVGELAWHLHRAGRLSGLSDALRPPNDRVDAIEGVPLEIKLEPGVTWKQSPYYNTVGIRKDMPAIEVTRQDTGEHVELPSPATLGLLYRTTGKTGYLRLALDHAMTVLEAAKPRYPEGRKHGCGARALHAFCVGHGRNWGAGYASTALRAALGDDAGEILLPRITL